MVQQRKRGIAAFILVILFQLSIAGMAVLSLFPFASFALLLPIIILALLTIVASIVLFIR